MFKQNTCRHRRKVHFKRVRLTKVVTFKDKPITIDYPVVKCLECGVLKVEARTAETIQAAVAKCAALGEPSGEAFRCLRKWVGVSAVQLGALLSTSNQQLSRWENGKVNTNPFHFRILAFMAMERMGATHHEDLKTYLSKPRVSSPLGYHELEEGFFMVDTGDRGLEISITMHDRDKSYVFLAGKYRARFFGDSLC